MSDLISRSEVNDVIDELEVYTCGRLNTTKVEVSVLQLQRFINKLKNIPIAYSVDKVVEELEKEAERWEDSGKEYKDKCEIAVGRGLRNSIKIVKQGNVSDDVCEWKLEDEESNLYATGCEQRHLVFYETPKENGYKFCPYCGKKIKVVE